MITMFLGALLLTQAPDPHAGHSMPAPAAEPAKKAEKKICKPDYTTTSSRMRKKLCLTETEWAQKTQGKNAGDLKTIGGR